jgi:hypothetical protein
VLVASGVVTLVCIRLARRGDKEVSDRRGPRWGWWTFALLVCVVLFDVVFVRGMAALLLGALVAVVTWPFRAVADQLVALQADSEQIKAVHGVGPAFGVLAALVFWAVVVTVVVVRVSARSEVGR